LWFSSWFGKIELPVDIKTGIVCRKKDVKSVEMLSSAYYVLVDVKPSIFATHDKENDLILKNHSTVSAKLYEYISNAKHNLSVFLAEAERRVSLFKDAN
jgi:hypothetical protein